MPLDVISEPIETNSVVTFQRAGRTFAAVRTEEGGWENTTPDLPRQAPWDLVCDWADSGTIEKCSGGSNGKGITIPAGREMTIKMHADGSAEIVGVDSLPEPEPREVYSLARFQVPAGLDTDTDEAVAFKVNDGPGPNWSVLSATGELFPSGAASWDEIIEQAKDGTLRTFAPSVKTGAPVR